MASFTRRELVDQVAFKVGILGVGSQLADDDFHAIDDMLGALFDQLAEDSILVIGDEDEIPASWCPYLATLAANLCAPQYGTAFDVGVKQANEAILRKLVRGHETFEVQRTDYF
jgi:hypothetical protein